MKRVFRIATLAVALSAAVPALAQEKGGTVGIGVGVSTFTLGFNSTTLMPGTVLFVPINLSPNFRLEPLISIDRSDIDADPVFQDGKFSSVALGAGAFYVGKVVPAVQMYVGGRLALHFMSFEEAAPVPDEWNRRDFILAAALGGEYLPHPRVAVGGEVMLGFVSIGETEFTPGGGTTVKGGGGSATQTQGTVFVRVYLF